MSKGFGGLEKGFRFESMSGFGDSPAWFLGLRIETLRPQAFLLSGRNNDASIDLLDQSAECIDGDASGVGRDKLVGGAIAEETTRAVAVPPSS